MLTKILWPASMIYWLGRVIHTATYSQKPLKASMPVIVIGNLNAGGSGKTPTAIALMSLIKNRKLAKNPAFITRGYGGDEQNLLSKHAPVIVDASRREALKTAEKEGYDLIIMDDGYQNPSFHKDLNILVVDGMMGFGNRFLLPAGPLRQSLHEGLSAANLYVFIGEDHVHAKKYLYRQTPCFDANLKPLNEPDKESTYYAFAGIGYPEKFYTYLEKKTKLSVKRKKAFPDHYHYTQSDLNELIIKSQKDDLTLITTEKDFAKIGSLENANKVKVLKVSLEFEQPGNLVSLIKDKIKLNEKN